MCGIFGAISQDSVPKTVEALHFLEYRGYDSAGIAYKRDNLRVVKTAGRVTALESKLPPDAASNVAIGHTRWATHGAVRDENAHPFLSPKGNFAICHNGIIENHRQLKAELGVGALFTSETDSEVVAHLLERNFTGDVLLATLHTARQLSGAFAVIIENVYDDSLYAIKNKSPLVVGMGTDGVYMCSDVRCVSNYVSRVAVVPDNTVVVLGANGVTFYDFDGRERSVEFFQPDQGATTETVEGDVMLKEIFEIPERIRDAKEGYFKSGRLALPARFVTRFRRIYFLGCGTAYNSGMQAAAVARKFLNVDLVPVVASEFVYDNYPVDDRTLAFCISQSGETADTIRAAEKVNSLGGFTYAVTNTDTSSLCFVCNGAKNVHAGGEFAVASTKAYNCQLVTLLLLMLDIAYLRGEIDQNVLHEIWQAMDELPLAVSSILERSGEIATLASDVKDSSAVFFVGRTLDFPTATEGSLKLKEISYIHSEAYPSGELKHGTLALMEKGVTVIALSTDANLVDKNNSTVCEISSRSATVLTVSPFHSDGVAITLPAVHSLLYGVVAVVPLQLLAYYVAKQLGRDVDKPRNLAKSVTVE